jgi:hypothetical protein
MVSGPTTLKVFSLKGETTKENLLSPSKGQYQFDSLNTVLCRTGVLL